MDDDGIPVAIEPFPGNTLDHLTLRKSLKKNIDGLDFSRFILIADRGICNYPKLLHVLDAGNGYIVSKSLLKSTKKEQEWAYDDDAYISVSGDFKYKSRIIKSLGYYQIVTSELAMDAREVIDKYHGLTQIEEQFRVMKSDLETRPIYVRTPEHITAHLLICMVALIMMWIIQKRIRDSGNVAVDPDAYWSSGLNSRRIQAALNKWKVDLLPGDLYRFMDVDDPDLKLILDAFGIHIPARLYRRAELRHIKTEINVFM